MIAAAVAVTAIISYDGTPHDDDALTLGRMLGSIGAQLSLAYVRHSHEYDPRREEIARHDAQRRLDLGGDWLGDPEISKHILVNPSTSAGLAAHATELGADLIVFGSDYRTSPGAVQPGGAAQWLLDGSPVAIAVAAAGLRAFGDAAISTVAVAGEADGAAAQTAGALIARTEAELVSGYSADIICVDSRPAAPSGRVALDGATRGHLDSARGSVIVLPGSTPLPF